MKKGIFISILFTLILICLSGYIVNAETYEDLTYIVTDGGISIIDCSEEVSNIVIPERINELPVTTIEQGAFSNCTKLTSVFIPNSVTSIGAGAFEGCKVLEEITLPFVGAEHVNNSEPKSAFGYIFGYTRNSSYSNYYIYKVPSSLKRVCITDYATIGERTFRSDYYNNFCYQYIEEVEILGGVKAIDKFAFRNCQSLKKIILPEGLLSIGNYAFEYCDIESLIIPESVETIGDCSFKGCSSLTNITLSNNLNSISDGVFSDCSSLESIIIPESVLNIGNAAFSNCKSLANVKIQNGVTSINSNAFLNCQSLKCIEIPKSVLDIDVSAFGGCSSLEEITLPFIGSQRGNSGAIDSVFGYIFGYVTSSSDASTDDIKQYYTSTGYAYYHIPISLKMVTITDESFVGYGAFYGCTNISDIVIDSNVKAIGSRAFAYHYNLLNVTIKSNSPKFADSMVFYDTDFATLYGYEGSTVEEYATENGIDFESLVLSGKCEIDGSIKAINNTLVVNVDINAIATAECLHIALYTDKGQMIDYIIVPPNKPFNNMNVVFKDANNASYAKVFLWNGFTSLQPLTEAKRIDIVR